MKKVELTSTASNESTPLLSLISINLHSHQHAWSRLKIYKQHKQYHPTRPHIGYDSVLPAPSHTGEELKFQCWVSCTTNNNFVVSISKWLRSKTFCWRLVICPLNKKNKNKSTKMKKKATATKTYKRLDLSILMETNGHPSSLLQIVGLWDWDWD